jgi:putative ABC transport system substrate-binding protein
MQFAQLERRDFVTLLGSAVAWPLTVRAEQRERMRHVGVLMGYAESDSESQRWIRAFVEGLHQQGWVVGSTIAIEYRWATGGVERMRPYAAELVALNPDVMLVASSPALATIRQEVSSVPIVFVNVFDPVGQGFVASLARPGGNITGLRRVNIQWLVNGSRFSNYFDHRSRALLSSFIPTPRHIFRCTGRRLNPLLRRWG